MKHYYLILKPRGRHISYRVIKQWCNDDGKRQSETLADERIDAVNSCLERKVYDVIAAEKVLKDIIKSIRVSEGLYVAPAIYHSDNQKILDDYFAKKYKRRHVIDKGTEYCALRRAVNALGNLSILKASSEEIQDQVDKQFTGNKQRRILSKLSLLLKFSGRIDMELHKNKPERRIVRYLSKSDLNKVLLFLSPEMQLIAQAAFYTGGRTGELFALTGLHNDRAVFINTQIDRAGVERDTKNRRPRTVIVESEAINVLEEWAKIKTEFSISRNRIATIFKSACLKAFPKDSRKALVFHDLRHSFAINLLSKGATIEEVAASLGDSVQVAQEYYTGFVLTSGAMDRLRNLTA